jgi:extracellular factor (EF) 3-hydroxypalmitic acid methyl ester biosynthesis protein
MMHLASAMSNLVNGNGNGNGHHQSVAAPQPAAKKPATRPLAPAPDVKESYVTFKIADSGELRGTLVRMTRHVVFFELYNPDFLPRLSEVLNEFKIIYQGRTIYSGRAIVRNLVDAETKIICEAMMDETGWTDMQLELISSRKGQVADEFKEFLQSWQNLYKVTPEFKVVVADMQTILHDLRLWLDRVELRISTSAKKDQKKNEQQLMEEVGRLFVPAFDVLHEKLEAISKNISEDSRPAHRVFAQRQLHSLMLCSPFGHRAYTKPLGYAGDYEMVNMIALNPYQGESLFAKIVNLWFLSQWPSEAHRNRLAYLKTHLEKETLRACQNHRKVRIFNFACGPALEIQRFLENFQLSDNAEFTLADFNQETLEQLAKKIKTIKEQHTRSTSVQFQRKNIVQVLKESMKKNATNPEYDFVYCAGLFDYLPDTTCSQLMEIFYSWLAPGGLLVVTNVVDDKPFRHMLEFVLDWNLIYRDTKEARLLFPKLIPEEVRSIKKDVTGVNIFIEARKPCD